MTTTIVDADVKAVIDTQRDTSPFIEAADIIVSETILVPDPDSNLGNCGSTTAVSTNRYNLIVKYLAAHLVFVTEANGMISSRVGGVGDDFYSRYADKSSGFGSTKYGALACQMDPTGRLASASANNGLKARFGVFKQTQRLPPDFWLFGWF